MSGLVRARSAGIALCLLASACSTTSTVTVAVPTQAGAAPVATAEGIGEANDSESAVAELNLAFEPADALLGDVAGWTAVDTWSLEPLNVPLMPSCEPMDLVLSLEDWGITTALWLRDSDELWQHVADLESEENAAAYVDTFGSLAAACSSQPTGGGPLVIESLEDATWPGFALAASDKTQATWLFDPGSRIQAVVLSRGNVVSIVTVVADDPTNLADLLEAATLAHQRLDVMVPDVMVPDVMVPDVMVPDAMVPESSAQQGQEQETPDQPDAEQEPAVEFDPQTGSEPVDESTAVEAPPELRPLVDYVPLPGAFGSWEMADDRFRPNEPSGFLSTPCTSDPLFTAIDTMPNHLRRWETTMRSQSSEGYLTDMIVTVGIDAAREEWPGQAAAISAWFGEFSDRCFGELQPFPIVGSQHPLDLVDFPQLSGTGFTFHDIYEAETQTFYGRTVYALLSVDDIIFSVAMQFRVVGTDDPAFDVADLRMTNRLELYVLPRIVEHLEGMADQE